MMKIDGMHIVEYPKIFYSQRNNGGIRVTTYCTSTTMTNEGAAATAMEVATTAAEVETMTTAFAASAGTEEALMGVARTSTPSQTASAVKMASHINQQGCASSTSSLPKYNVARQRRAGLFACCKGSSGSSGAKQRKRSSQMYKVHHFLCTIKLAVQCVCLTFSPFLQNSNHFSPLLSSIPLRHVQNQKLGINAVMQNLSMY